MEISERKHSSASIPWTSEVWTEDVTDGVGFCGFNDLSLSFSLSPALCVELEAAILLSKLR
jgi:hypothetical protein